MQESLFQEVSKSLAKSKQEEKKLSQQINFHSREIETLKTIITKSSQREDALNSHIEELEKHVDDTKRQMKECLEKYTAFKEKLLKTVANKTAKLQNTASQETQVDIYSPAIEDFQKKIQNLEKDNTQLRTENTRYG